MTTITCDKKYLIQRCVERGYALDKVMPCVTSRDGDRWTVDTTHWAYPYERRGTANGGPGTELKAMLRAVGIKSTPNCSCNAKAKAMDVRGVAWCESNVPIVVRWLHEEAKRRRLPFVKLAATALVKKAISRARRKASKR